MRTFKPNRPELNSTWTLLFEVEDGYSFKGKNGLVVIMSGAYENRF